MYKCDVFCRYCWHEVFFTLLFQCFRSDIGIEFIKKQECMTNAAKYCTKTFFRGRDLFMQSMSVESRQFRAKKTKNLGETPTSVD